MDKYEEIIKRINKLRYDVEANSVNINPISEKLLKDAGIIIFLCTDLMNDLLFQERKEKNKDLPINFDFESWLKN